VGPKPDIWTCRHCGWQCDYGAAVASWYQCPECTKQRGKKYRASLKTDPEKHAAHLAYHRVSQTNRNRTHRWAVLVGYGGDPPRCACCGEQTVEFLCLDHVNSDAPADRKRFSTHLVFFTYLIKNNFPDRDRYQVLCHNCNLAKGFYGECPHERQRREEIAAD
jgi:hypothetical protein